MMKPLSGYDKMMFFRFLTCESHDKCILAISDRILSLEEENGYRAEEKREPMPVIRLFGKDSKKIRLDVLIVFLLVIRIAN